VWIFVHVAAVPPDEEPLLLAPDEDAPDEDAPDEPELLAPPELVVLPELELPLAPDVPPELLLDAPDVPEPPLVPDPPLVPVAPEEVPGSAEAGSVGLDAVVGDCEVPVPPYGPPRGGSDALAQPAKATEAATTRVLEIVSAREARMVLSLSANVSPVQ
jgi:hypothetical protein